MQLMLQGSETHPGTPACAKGQWPLGRLPAEVQPCHALLWGLRSIALCTVNMQLHVDCQAQRLCCCYGRCVLADGCLLNWHRIPWHTLRPAFEGSHLLQSTDLAGVLRMQRGWWPRSSQGSSPLTRLGVHSRSITLR